VGVERAEKLFPYGPGVIAKKGGTKMAAAKKDTIKQIHDLLPKLNCGFCGFGNCGQFAKAVAEGSASPFGCRQNPWAGYSISEVVGMRVPVFGYQQRFYQPIFAQRPGPTASLEALKKEVTALSKQIDGILDRIENLKGM
jgi:Na+-translocating ferredoxin:NAD+ oxidoreductase RNF subunit RnfB